MKEVRRLTEGPEEDIKETAGKKEGRKDGWKKERLCNSRGGVIIFPC